MNVRAIIWLFTAGLIIVLCLLYGQVTSHFNSAGTNRFLLSFSIAILGIASVFLFPDTNNKKKIILILALSSISRLSLLPSAPSDDINRYLWEGKLTSLGVSPFKGLADDLIYEEYRDKYWAEMNHRDKPTAYPPIAMQTFRLINSLGYTPTSYKVVLMMLDLLIIATILALLHHYRRPLHWSLFYAISPISLLSFSAEGHFDVLMVLAFTFALLAISKRWFITCGVAIGIAIGTKVMAAVIAPLILWKAGWKAIIASFLTLSIPLIIYLDDMIRLFLGLFVFGSEGRFNGPIHQVLSSLFDDYDLATKTVAILFILMWLLGFYIMLKRHLLSGLLISFSSLIILSPIVHFWYLSWILPLVALRPKLSFISLSVTMSLYFLVWEQQSKGLPWNMPTWALWSFWIPFFILLITENRHFLCRFSHLKSHLKSSPKGSSLSITIVIPTYNPGKSLQLCIDNLAEQSIHPDEIIIVDAYSSDQSVALLDLHDLPITTLYSKLGRGIQIKAGVEAATANWIIILHADNLLAPHSLLQLKEVIHKNPNIIGGSLGQRFSNFSLGLLLIECMNEFRATLLQTSFGDQTQFFHRQTSLRHSILTSQPLMEDVEMSNRLNSIGETLHIAHQGTVSSKKWDEGHFIKRFITIVEFYFKYKFLTFTKAQRHALSERFYKRYYPTSEE